MSDRLRFSGIMPANILPFTADLEIDEPAYRRHLRWLADAPGVTGIVANGHAAEVSSLTREERKRALAIALEKCFQTACLALAALDLAPVLKNVSNRTLVLSGSEDATTPPALARELANGIPGARFEELKGCGHCPQIENPAAFVAAVERFLG